MQFNKTILMTNYNRLKTLPFVAMMLLPISGMAQKSKAEKQEPSPRVELEYKQRHSPIMRGANIYADGIQIKRDLSILKEIQEERVLAADEFSDNDIYGGTWSTRYVNAYGALENVPDTFNVDLSNFAIPHTGYVTSRFGPRRRRMHYGIDLKVYEGDTIYAAFNGKIRVKQYERRGYGYYLVMRHGNGLETVYGHLSEFLVDEGDVVKSGQPIGLGGNTGRSTGAHLHFEMRYVGKPINPETLVDFDNKSTYRDSYTITPATFDYPKKLVKGKNATYLANAKTRSKGATTNKFVAGKVNFHRVQRGENLGSIARKYGVSVSKLCSLNGISSKTVIKAGKTIRTS